MMRLKKEGLLAPGPANLAQIRAKFRDRIIRLSGSGLTLGRVPYVSIKRKLKSSVCPAHCRGMISSIHAIAVVSLCPIRAPPGPGTSTFQHGFSCSEKTKRGDLWTGFIQTSPLTRTLAQNRAETLQLANFR